MSRARYQDEGFVGETWGSRGSGILLTTGKRILLLLRSWQVEDPGVWGVPGGAVPRDPSSNRFMSPYSSARKEAGEELGVPLPRAKRVTSVVFHHSNGRFTYETFVLRVPESATRVEFPLNWESDDSRWFTRGELEDVEVHPGVSYVLDQAGDLVFDAKMGSRSRVPDMRALVAAARRINRRG